jgi:hypothetical protein
MAGRLDMGKSPDSTVCRHQFSTGFPLSGFYALHRRSVEHLTEEYAADISAA